MNLLEQTKFLLKKTGLRPDKLKGQNFCIDQKVLADMIAAAELKNTDTVVEVGAGFGFLTVELAKKAGSVIAVEIERPLIKGLNSLQAVNKNLQVFNQDILKLKDSDLPEGDYKIIANLPYSITSFFLKKFITAKHKPISMTLLVQKEVAERICAPEGQMSLLALSIQLYAKPKIVKIVSPASFFPVPKVASAIIKIGNISDFPFVDKISEHFFWSILHAGFCAKRKTLANNFANSLHLNKADVKQILAKIGLKYTVRAQELSLDDWLKVSLRLTK